MGKIAIIHSTAGIHCCNLRWEVAYERFESTADQKKIRERFFRMEFARLERSLKVVGLVYRCGNALHVLRDVGFANLAGVDIALSLLSQAAADVKRIMADCTDLWFAPGSVDRSSSQAACATYVT